MAPNATNDEETKEQAELPNTEVVENSPQASGEVEALSTFSASHGPLKLKVIPSVSRTGTEWRAIVYSRGVRGSLLETNKPITNEAADQLGIPHQLQERMNNALEYAQRQLEVPQGLGNQTRNKQSLGDLEALMDE